MVASSFIIEITMGHHNLLFIFHHFLGLGHQRSSFTARKDKINPAVKGPDVQASAIFSLSSASKMENYVSCRG